MYRPGESGNLKGRPKGIPTKRTKMTNEITELAMEHALPIARQLIEKALTGDVKAADLFFRIFLPKRISLEEKVLLDIKDNSLPGQIKSLTEGISFFDEVTQDEAIERLKTFSTIKSNEIMEDQNNSIRESREQIMANVEKLEKMIEYKKGKG